MSRTISNVVVVHQADSEGRASAGAMAAIGPGAFADLLRARGGDRVPVLEPSSPRGSPPSSGTVAVVDDHLDVHEMLAMRLGMVPGVKLVGRGFNGADALDLARAVGPDLIILDLRMPIMGDEEAIPLLRVIAPNVRIIVYTSDEHQAKLAGGSRPDAIVLKGAHLGDWLRRSSACSRKSQPTCWRSTSGASRCRSVDAFDSWVGLNARVRHALDAEGDASTELSFGGGDRI